jgi:hypothetical protein
VSDGRVVTGAQASAGQRSGTSGTKIGQASLPGAFSEAAVRCRRTQPAGQQSLGRVEHNHGQGKALTVWAHQLARAVLHLLKRTTAGEMAQCLRRSGRGAGEPAASRGRDGLRLAPVRCRAGRLVAANPAEHRGPGP